MVNIKKLQGNFLKNLLGAKRVRKTYHNHNKSGGNFGFVIVMVNPKLSPQNRPDEKWYRLDGVHNLEGEITHTRFSDYGSWTPEGDADLQVLQKKLFDAGVFNYGAW